MATITKTPHGRYEHGKPWYQNQCWHRTDLYTSDNPEHRDLNQPDRLFAAGKDDDSPIHLGPYNPKCSCCWLGFSHTERAHVTRV